MPAVLDTRHQLLLCWAAAAELIAPQALGGALITPALDQHVEHPPGPVDRTPRLPALLPIRKPAGSQVDGAAAGMVRLADFVEYNNAPLNVEGHSTAIKADAIMELCSTKRFD